MVKKKNTSDRKNIIIVCLVFLLLALLWGFAVPHYSCESHKNRCDFKFWGKYYSKDDCEKKCKISPTTSPPVFETSVEAPSVSKRYFCANVTHNDGNSYKMCAPCKPHSAYKYGAKYVVNGDTLETQACDTNNSFDSQDNCVSALKNDGKYNYDAKQLDGCLPIAYNYVTDYITDIQPLYYTNDYCNNCLYSDCNTCETPWCGKCCPNCTPASTIRPFTNTGIFTTNTRTFTNTRTYANIRIFTTTRTRTYANIRIFTTFNFKNTKDNTKTPRISNST